MLRTDDGIYELLKTLKAIGGNSNSIDISSSDLGKAMGLSQQSASRLIIKAVKDGYIERGISGRKQKITITEKGLGVLVQEFSELSIMLNQQETAVIKGYTQSGLGEGRYYISRKQYIVQFNEKLGFIPYLGTLNLKIDPDSEVALRKLRSMPGIHIDGFRTDDRTFGAVKAFHAKIDGIESALIFPERSVYSDVIEIISREYLRERLNLKDGSLVTVEVSLSGY